MVRVNTILPDFFKALGMNVKKLDFANEFGFFTLWGLLAGIAINDVWRILKLPGEGLPVIVGNQAQAMEIDYVYQLVIAGLIMLSAAFGVKYAFGFGSGMALGSTLANQVESGQALTLLPFSLEPKQ